MTKTSLSHNHFEGSKTVIRVKNFEASKHFYTELLNLEISETYNDGDGSKGLILRIGPAGNTTFIEISEIKETHSYYQDAFNATLSNDKLDIQLKTNDIDYWTTLLKDKWETRGPILRPWGSHYLYLRDPDGLQIIIYQESSN